MRTVRSALGDEWLEARNYMIKRVSSLFVVSHLVVAWEMGRAIPWNSTYFPSLADMRFTRLTQNEYI
eukprot:scaffold4213_cov201-Ochromonas_danica.AAC.4